MAKKISELAAVTDVQDTDQFVLARSGATDSITGANLKANIRAAGCAVVRGPYTFTPATSGLATGVSIYTPTVGDVFLNAFICIDVAFDGTTPQFDIGTFVAANYGLFGGYDLPVDLTLADVDGGTGVGSGTGIQINLHQTFGGYDVMSMNNEAAAGTGRIAPALFTATNPVKIVVSRTGQKGGTAINSTVGSARVYLITATPLSL